MKVTFYSRPDIQACNRVRKILDRFEGEYDLQITETRVGASFEAPNGQVVKVPALHVEGSRLNVLDSTRAALDEATIRAYLELAKATGTGSGSREQAARVRAALISEGESMQPAPRGRAVPGIGFRAKMYLWEHRVGAIIAALSAFIGLSWLAPLLPSGAYSAIFGAYRWVCLQTPDRSPQIAGHQGCLCWRCIAIYAGSLLFGILYTFGRDGRLPHMEWLTKGIGFKGLLIFSLPMFVDGLSHTFGLRPGVAYAHSPDFWLSWGEFQADWWLRVATSLFATVGAVRFLCPRLDKIAQGYAALTRRVAPSAGLATS